MAMSAKSSKGMGSVKATRKAPQPTKKGSLGKGARVSKTN